jgi:hypothetical protein
VRHHRHRAGPARDGRGDVGDDARAPHAGDHDGPRPAVLDDGCERRGLDVHQRLSDLGAGRGDGAQHLARVQELEGVPVVEDRVVHRR